MGAVLVGFGATRWGLAGRARLAPPPPYRIVEESIDVPEISSLTMVALRGGTFYMKAADRHIQVPRFKIQQVPVTKALYAAVTGEKRGVGSNDAPVNNVKWFEAIAFCNQLSKRAGYTPCYAISDDKQVEWNPYADGFRLPTEAEWEFALRAGTKTDYFFGPQRNAHKYAWFEGSVNQPQPVGQKLSNPWQLHDMTGNVWEWCWDTSPQGNEDIVTYMTNEAFRKSAPGGVRVLRGGAFDYDAEFLGSSIRFRFAPGFRFEFVGFRCVRGSRRQSVLDH
ncbi:MAG: formylglycine-generating enzyme family protein [Myxococcota bacterium]